MDYDTIKKDKADKMPVVPNMFDYEKARESFKWEDIKKINVVNVKVSSKLFTLLFEKCKGNYGAGCMQLVNIGPGRNLDLKDNQIQLFDNWIEFDV